MCIFSPPHRNDSNVLHLFYDGDEYGRSPLRQHLAIMEQNIIEGDDRFEDFEDHEAAGTRRAEL
jgi:hypothetical protein